LTDFLILLRDSETDPWRYVGTTVDREPDEGAKVIEDVQIGEGDYLAFPMDAAISRSVRIHFSVEVGRPM